MAPQFPSIQSFFKPKASSPRKSTTNETSMAGDGFTTEELESSRQPKLRPWLPKAEYREADIEGLVPGPGCLCLVGRVVNLYNQQGSSKMSYAAKGCLRLIVKDDTGAIMVHLPSQSIRNSLTKSPGQAFLRKS